MLYLMFKSWPRFTFSPITVFQKPGFSPIFALQLLFIWLGISTHVWVLIPGWACQNVTIWETDCLGNAPALGIIRNLSFLFFWRRRYIKWYLRRSCHIDGCEFLYTYLYPFLYNVCWSFHPRIIFFLFPQFSSTLPSTITNVSKYWQQRIRLQGNWVPFWFRVGFWFAPGSPFSRGNSEGRTLSPKRPVALLCYTNAKSWSRWYVY